MYPTVPTMLPVSVSGSLSGDRLDSADGERPFRQLAQPITFAPRSVIRMEVTEVSRVAGTLHVSLHGYKVLGGAGSPTGRLPGQRRATR